MLCYIHWVCLLFVTTIHETYLEECDNVLDSHGRLSPSQMLYFSMNRFPNWIFSLQKIYVIYYLRYGKKQDVRLLWSPTILTKQSTCQIVLKFFLTGHQ